MTIHHSDAQAPAVAIPYGRGFILVTVMASLTTAILIGSLIAAVATPSQTGQPSEARQCEVLSPPGSPMRSAP